MAEDAEEVRGFAYRRPSRQRPGGGRMQSLCTRVTWAQLLNITAFASPRVEVSQAPSALIAAQHSSVLQLIHCWEKKNKKPRGYLHVNTRYLLSLGCRRSFPRWSSGVSCPSNPNPPRLPFIRLALCFVGSSSITQTWDLRPKAAEPKPRPDFFSLKKKSLRLT